ncbi:MAG: CBS domain-containing protein [Ardenticatenia bacterium]|nr:CBS domain-containing protein [Ardenticatenia bacterium]
MSRRRSLVSAWMTPRPITITPSASVAEAYRLMREFGVRRLPVVDDKRALIGIVTLSDIQRLIPLTSEEQDVESALLLKDVVVEEIMTWDPIAVRPDVTVQEAAELMLDFQVSGLPVIEGKRVVGIITESDIFRLVVEEWRQEEEQ